MVAQSAIIGGIIVVVLVIGAVVLYSGEANNSPASSTVQTTVEASTVPSTTAATTIAETSLTTAPTTTIESNTTTNDTSQGTTQNFNIVETEFSISPQQIIVNSGDTVILHIDNQGSTVHNVRLVGTTITSNLISPGASDILEFIAPAPGNYTYYCSVDSHRSFGMQGSLLVT